jgi:hypothetical protein
VDGTRVGYARCSTDEQDVIVQIEQLAALGVTPDPTYVGGVEHALDWARGRTSCAPPAD